MTLIAMLTILMVISGGTYSSVNEDDHHVSENYRQQPGKIVWTAMAVMALADVDRTEETLAKAASIRRSKSLASKICWLTATSWIILIYIDSLLRKATVVWGLGDTAVTYRITLSFIRLKRTFLINIILKQKKK